MKGLFKGLLMIFLMFCISVVCMFCVIYIDNNNLMDSVLEKAPLEASAFISSNLKKARLSFAMPHDPRPIVVDISERNSNDVEYQYIYPSQIFYASATEVRLLFRDSIFSVSNNLGLKSIKERLQSSHGSAFLYTQSHAINRAAIVGLLRLGQQSYNYKYFVRLINEEELSISKATYKEITKNIELATPDYGF